MKQELGRNGKKEPAECGTRNYRDGWIHRGCRCCSKHIPAPRKDRVLARLKYQSKSVLGRLKQKGEIEFEERDGKQYARLTERGEEALALGQQKMQLATSKPRKWDRRYRLVMFDVPERRKKIRERLRFQMRDAGFLRIQDSAWLYPYDCEEFMALLKADLRIGKDVLYAVVEEIENDRWIRKHFGLPAE